MGRPPCCDKVGIKKGPWTPEEDIILVSYIQEHGPGNWRSVPTNTGLLRCSKSCRLRWTNYLRPGIKRGNFTPHEEGMIIHLQALLGNKWAAIASYLPQRTDNDIKNYWNTHLKKKLKKFQSAALDSIPTTSERSRNVYNLSPISSRNVTNSPSSSSTYASSTENISRLLQGWMTSSPKTTFYGNNTTTNDGASIIIGNSPVGNDNVKGVAVQEMSNGLISHEEFESILSFENLNNISAWDKCTCDSASEEKEAENKKKQKSEINNNPPLSFLEKWLLDESTGNSDQVLEEEEGEGEGEEEDEAMELSPIF